jgi:hypothetical protein
MITFPTALVAGAIVLLLLVIIARRRARTSDKAARPRRPNRPLAHSAQAGALGKGLEWDFAESAKIGRDNASDPSCSALDDSGEGDRCEDGGSADTGSDTDCGSGNTD